MLDLGHERIAFIGGVSQMGVRQDRLAGFAAALEARGTSVDHSLVVEAPPTKNGGFTAMKSLLARPDRPTATLCFNDVVAIGAMGALGRGGLVPGRDMAVIGFDDTAEASQMSPALTTVSVGAGDLGERAGQMLLRQIERTASGPETYVGEARLVVRESCGKSLRVREVA